MQAGGSNEELISNLLDDVPKKLYRRTQLEFAKDFVARGAIRFKPLNYYWGREDAASPWRDPQEGRPIYKFEKDTAVEIKIADTGRLIFQGKLKQGHVEHDIGLPHHFHIFCMCTDYNKLPSDLGGAIIELSDSVEFTCRLQTLLLKKLNLPLSFGLVKYCDDDPRILSGAKSMLWQYKSPTFANEKEFRYCVKFRPWNAIRALCKAGKQERPSLITHTNFSLDVELGDLRDIARLI